jgi:hypothetical protein
LAREDLVLIRQVGHLLVVPVPPDKLQVQIDTLTNAIGPAEFEDAEIIVFRPR